ncbi:DUF1499 domain-containing protein [Hydrogenophaga sp. PAMC20947]|uniref:DUF1499 domain-containing protein n=1 Tax=Hydrogenophaga sp. PAMC20947 TaxID=2565558 RepID=UPI00109DEDA8|nr:DUF1499 domain-containing protein [Hydrogenophaga sp. PAMC20947]QCB44638.1 DUF1499 domain-containing protein [Hydrogenophaga sp. PAMC20947]
MSTQKAGLTLGTAALGLALSLLLGGCATSGPAPGGTADPTGAALACTLSSNCVNSLPGSDLAPLRFDGSAVEAMAALRVSLAAFPEARIVKAESLAMEVVFTTSVGFQDRVNFLIDAPRQRIDYSSRSRFGLYDFGKNRSRMEAFARQFEQGRAR